MKLSLGWVGVAVLIGAEVLLLSGVLWFLNREHKLRLNAQQQEEAVTLTLNNQIVEAQQGKRELEATLSDELKKNSQLKDAYDQALRAAPSARPVSVSKLGTGPLSTPPPPPAAVPTPSSGAAAPSSGAADQSPQCPACMLQWGDKLSVDVNVLELKTQSQNTLIVGTAAVFRESPPPRMQLAGGPFQSSLTRSSELGAAPEPRWGVMALGACGTSGCGPGAAILFPPVTVLGHRLEGLAGGVATPGAALGVVGLGGRF